MAQVEPDVCRRKETRMLKARVGAGLFAGCLLLWGGAAQAAPQAATMLKYHPKQDDVLYDTPSAQEVEACKVEPIKGQGKGAGWLLRDPQGRPLRRFYDTQYDGVTRTTLDVFSYYHDGVETYRETYVNTREEPDQVHYRWLNAGGMKWGVDYNKDGKIDAWKAISPEEVSQEALRAVVKNDFARLQALLITDADLKALELPPDQVRRIQELRRGAEARFQATVKKMSGLGDKTHWVHLETAAPQCQPADQAGARGDVIRYARGTVLCETNGKSDWLQTGEMIQVGSAWRLLDAPTPGAGDGGEAGAGTGADNPEVQKLLKELGDLDAAWAKRQTPPPPPADVVRYNLDRTSLIEKIGAAVKPEEREQWLRQEADCLGAAAQSSPPGDKAAYARLAELEGRLQKALPPGNALVAYVTFREMQADYNSKILDPKNKGDKDFTKIHEEWLGRLAKFVQAYPSADDTADALLSLGWVSETIGKETEAQNWYKQLARDFGDRPQAVKARGALRRLDLEGRPLELAGTTLGGSPFDLGKLRGKVVVVYYWWTFNDPPVGDFAKLKMLLERYKGVELVTVNLDNSVEEAKGFVARTSAPGTHLFQAGGLEGKLATDYGVMMLPNLFLVNKDGKVVNRTVQVGNLDDELKKLTK
jgi:hypothetical protein